MRHDHLRMRKGKSRPPPDPSLPPSVHFDNSQFTIRTSHFALPTCSCPWVRFMLYALMLYALMRSLDTSSKTTRYTQLASRAVPMGSGCHLPQLNERWTVLVGACMRCTRCAFGSGRRSRGMTVVLTMMALSMPQALECGMSDIGPHVSCPVYRLVGSCPAPS